MTKERRLGISEVEKLLVTGAALTGLLLFSSAPRLHADEEKCHRQLARADHRLHEAVEITVGTADKRFTHGISMT